jgi:predicted kinase
MVGIPGSGKSTEAHKILMEDPIHTAYISRDVVRLNIIKDNEHLFSHEDEVYDKFCDEIAAWLEKSNVIADATHMSHGARAKLINALAYRGMTADKYDLVFVYMDVPIEECIRRDETRDGRAHVTAPVIRRMARSLTCPTMDEFTNVKEVRIIHE